MTAMSSASPLIVTPKTHRELILLWLRLELPVEVMNSYAQEWILLSRSASGSWAKYLAQKRVSPNDLQRAFRLAPRA
jgi:hypothetical protein